MRASTSSSPSSSPSSSSASPTSSSASLAAVLLALFAPALVSALFASACGSSDSPAAAPDASADATAGDAAIPVDASGDSAPSADAGPSDAAPDARAVGCPRTPAAADRARKVVVSHPFGADGGKAGGFEVLDLSADGKVTRPAAPVMFTMGTALDAPVVFTPDGEIGLVAQDDGSVGEFKMAGGAPQVVNAAFKAGFFASRVVLSADGAYAYVLDQDTANNGGGVYEVAIGCDGTLTSNGLVFPGNNAWAMALVPTDPTKAVLAAVSTLDSPAGKDTHIVDLVAHTRVASVAGFPDTDAIPSSVAVTPDGKYALVADDNTIAGGNRVAVVSLAGAMGSAGVLSTPNPAFVVVSPFGNAALVMNDDSTDQIHVLSYDAADAGTPFTITGELAYKFPKPQIPITAGVIAQGALKGLVLVGEVSAVRTVTFTSAGAAVDTAQLTFDPNDLSLGVGVIGVQP